MNLLKYTNGVGHLIMSIISTATGLALILLSNNPAIQGTGVTLILTVNGAWFISGSARQVATEVVNQLPPTDNATTVSMKAIPKTITKETPNATT
jgi:hypothetical protein